MMDLNDIILLVDSMRVDLAIQANNMSKLEEDNYALKRKVTKALASEARAKQSLAVAVRERRRMVDAIKFIQNTIQDKDAVLRGPTDASIHTVDCEGKTLAEIYDVVKANLRSEERE